MNIKIVDFLAQAIKDKPTDASDCKNLADARRELSRLRRVTAKVVKVLSAAKDLAAGTAIAPAPQDQIHNSQEEEKKKKKRPTLRRRALTVDQSFKVYKKITVEKSLENRALIKSAIKNNSLFREYLEAQLEIFIDVFVPKTVEDGAVVFRQGDLGDVFYVVQSGSLDSFVVVGEGDKKTEQQVGVPFRRGGVFGELGLLYDNRRAVTIRASRDCDLWQISRKAFKGLQLKIEKAAHEIKLKQLESVKIGEHMLSHVMDLSQLESMAMATEYQKFEAGAIIVKEGEQGNTFYIITKGEVDVYKETEGRKKLVTLGVDSFFGEKALLSSDTRQATCVASTNVECLALTRDDFVRMLGNLDDVIAGRKSNILNRSVKMTPSLYLKEDTDLSLNDLKFRRVLGEGAFGKVNLVKSKIDGKLFALKAQSKSHVIKNGSKEKLITEYRIMNELSHPTIVECYQVFQDRKYIFFLMGLLPGGEVLDLLYKHEKFPESWTRFYGATIVLFFEYIHEQKIAYRDLKPENLVLDENGYCRVVDLGLTKRCNNGKTWTMCGTPDYLAPEIVTGKGHDWGVDYWAFGVLLYELTYGMPPFHDANPMNTAKNVMNGSFSIPPHFSRLLVDLVSQLLTDQSKRLGRTKGGVRNIRKHPWFSEFDFLALLNRTMKVPFAPQLGNLEKLGKKDDGKWDAPDSDWEPSFAHPDSRRQSSPHVRISGSSGMRRTYLNRSVNM